MYGSVFFLLIVCIVVSASAFRHNSMRASVKARVGRLFSEEPAAEKSEVAPAPTPAKAPTELVAVNEESISNAAGVSSAVFGFLFGGPLFSLIFGTVGVYVSKKDNEVGEGLRGIGKAIVESYNYVTKLNNKYDVSGKLSSSVEKALESSDNDAAKSLKSAIAKVDEINKEYDITGKTSSAISATTTLSEAAYEKVEELNEKYDFVKTSKKVASEAFDKVREALREFELCSVNSV